MSVDSPVSAPCTSRRGLLKLLGLASVGTVVASRFAPAVLAGPPSPEAQAAPMGSLGTRVEGFDGGEISAISGLVRIPALAPKSRLAACVLTQGAPGGVGAQQLVHGVNGMVLTLPGGVKVSGLEPFAADVAAEHGAHRLFAGLRGPDPMDVFGWSAAVSPDGMPAADVEVRWRGMVRGGASRGDVVAFLAGYHAVVLGSLAPDGTFDDFVTYARIPRIG